MSNICADAIRHAGLVSQEWETLSRYVTKNTGMTHIAKQQSVAGLKCSNCVLLCNLDKHGRVINVAFTAHAGAGREPPGAARLRRKWFDPAE